MDFVLLEVFIEGVFLCDLYDDVEALAEAFVIFCKCLVCCELFGAMHPLFIFHLCLPVCDDLVKVANIWDGDALGVFKWSCEYNQNLLLLAKITNLRKRTWLNLYTVVPARLLNHAWRLGWFLAHPELRWGIVTISEIAQDTFVSVLESSAMSLNSSSVRPNKKMEDGASGCRRSSFQGRQRSCCVSATTSKWSNAS